MAIPHPPRGRYDGLVLRLIRDHGPQSRTRLSEETGLSPTTVTKIAAPLLERGWLREHAEHDSAARVGRPAIALEQVPEAVTVLGIRLGYELAQIGLTDAWGRPKATTTLRVDSSAPPAEILAEVADAAAGLVEEHGGSCLAIGAAVPGAIDHRQRTLLLAVNMGWQNVPVADILEDRLGIPAIIDQNVRAMALAEARYGGYDTDSLAYIYIGYGLGLGVVLQGRPFWGGGRHGVIQLGHTRVAGGTELCVCGATGCLETVASEPWILRHLKAAGVAVVPASERNAFAQLEEARFRPEVAAIRHDVVVNLAHGVANVISLLDPGLVLLGGALVDAPSSLLADMRARVQQEVFPLLREDLRFGTPRMPGISAGAAIALETFYYGSHTEPSVPNGTMGRQRDPGPALLRW